LVLGDDAELHGLLEALSRQSFAIVEVRREPTVEVGND
jgi:ribosomal protein S12 methylthiotransferase accessory factor YcaO